ncbi:hypothetical protein RN001_009551 [Aquatica leii]|uniref:Heat shock protein 70 n=1 Tax=Aquatica leii TaxID=1421715 RepID=A0AAN7NZR7_9COLE|nr:hypothetical protein RN001_009551 [Aquatica leii]
MMTIDTPVIGIDLGTTHCCVGTLEGDNVHIIENLHGERTTPSYIAFTDNKEIIGKNAKERVSRNPTNVIYDSKRLIGRLFNDEYIQHNLPSWFFKITEGEENMPVIQVTRNDETLTYKPYKISAKLLTYMKKIAEQKLGQKINSAVITVPAYFNYNQRIATKKAAKLAKLHVIKIMNEPTAAALAYVHKNDINTCKNVLVFDLGGGTFDVSVVNVVDKDITVKATSGNTFLGGRDFDNNLCYFIAKKLQKTYNVNVEEIPTSIRRLNARCEKIKITLSFEEEVPLDLHNLLNNGQDVDMVITKKEFEAINEHLFKLCLTTVENCLKQAEISKEDVEKVLLVGGSTRIPRLREMLTEYFNDSERICQGINPDEAVAYGAAIEASTYKKDKNAITHRINEVTPLSLGIDVMGNVMSFVIKRNTPIPVSVTKTYITVSDRQREMTLNVYEGERALVKYNTKIGTCIINLPPRPPGYPVTVHFEIDANGILDVGTSTETGLYSKLSIEYDKHIGKAPDDALQDAIENKENDQKENEVITNWIRLKEYCINLRSLFTYKCDDFDDEEKDILEKKIDSVSIWVYNHKVDKGTKEEGEAILSKLEEVESVCDPILNKHGYNIANLCISELYKIYKLLPNCAIAQ